MLSLGLLGALPFIVLSAGFVSCVKTGSTAGIGRRGAERRFIGWTATLSIYLSPQSFEELPAVTMRQRGMQCDKLALDGPEGSGSRPGGLIWGRGTPLLGWSSAGLHAAGVMAMWATYASAEHHLHLRVYL